MYTWYIYTHNRIILRPDYTTGAGGTKNKKQKILINNINNILLNFTDVDI